MNFSDDKILYVPGMKPKPRPEDHAAMLWRSLCDGVRRADAELAGQLASHQEIFELVAWPHLFYDEKTSIEPDLPGIDRLLKLDGPEDRDREEAKHWHKRFGQLMYSLSDTFPALIKFVANPDIKMMLQDTQRYFRNDQGVATQIREVIANALTAACSANKRIMVVAHSLGSVIAYDTLWELSRKSDSDVRVDEFVTIGSPLGLNFMQHRIRSSRERGEQRFPDNIRQWRNLSAIGEMTSLDRRMAKDFAPMVEAGLVESITDDIALETYFRGPDGLNVHKCYGYMANIKTGAVIAEWLRTS